MVSGLLSSCKTCRSWNIVSKYK